MAVSSSAADAEDMAMSSGDEFAGMNWQPRPYQIHAVHRAREFLRNGKRSALIVMPTGTGKTLVFAAVTRLAKNKGGRVLILAHRDELIQQAANKLAESAGIVAAIEKAKHQARRDWSLMHGAEPPVVVASVQTMRGDRLKSWPRDYFTLIVIDEAHHSPAKSYVDILDHFARARVLGVTATPDRADGIDLGEVFHSDDGKPAYEYSLREAIDQEYLVPIRTVRLDVGVDLSDIMTTRRGDFSPEELEELIGPHVETLANAVIPEIGKEPTIVFTPDTGSAEGFASALRSPDFGIAAEAVSYLNPEHRRKAVERFLKRETQVIVNCCILLEGFDAPPTSRIVMCRPTKSRTLYAQAIGRGTRLSPGKHECVVIDFTWGADTHQLIKPAHLLATPEDPLELFALVEEMTKENPEMELAEAVDRGREEIENRRRRTLEVEARRKAVRVFERREFDPVGVRAERLLGVIDAEAAPDAPRKDRDGPRATEKQAAALAKFGFPGAETWSRKRASNLLDALIGRAKEGKATWKQLQYAVALGMDIGSAREASRTDVSQFIDRSRRPSEVYA
jgi:superfamily II DNA or RNA helicase